MTAKEAIRALEALGNPEKARFLQRFFKTGPGEYAHGDRFIGVNVPPIRRLVTKFRGLPLAETVPLIRSPIHETRLMGLLILVAKYARADEAEREKIYRLYLRHRSRVNNWDLVDVTAPLIVGAHLYERDRKPLFELAESKRLWDRRIAIVSTHYFIRRDDLDDTLGIAERLLDDREDLMHKATGWMLREVGKRDLKTLLGFLDRHAEKMPRTMLRYAIERFREPLRKSYLARKRTSVSSLGTR